MKYLNVGLVCLGLVSVNACGHRAGSGLEPIP
jgi:hypothetical protein